MMRTAMQCALPLALCLVYTGSAAARQSAGQSQQDSPAKKPDPAPPAGKQGVAPAAMPAGETDPLKMAAPQTDGTSKPDVNAPVGEKTYVIGAEDVLVITVWNSPQLSGTHTVRPDGRISIPLVGEVTASGQTPMQLEEQIVDKLKAGNLIRNPSVAVSVSQVNSKKYYLQGEVNKPGAYNLIVPTTVLEALVNAGGFRDFAKETRIRIIRGKETYFFNYKQVIKNQKTDQNIILKPGDIIIVP